MKSHKLKIITIAIILAFTSNVYAERVPYLLSLKNLNKASEIDTLVIIENGVTYISKDDFEQIYGNKIVLETKTINGIDYYAENTLGKLELNKETLTAKLELAPKFMPKQEFSLNSFRYGELPEFQSGKYMNYEATHDTYNNFSSYTLSPHFSTESGNFGDASFNWNSYNGSTLLKANFNVRNKENNTLTRFGTSNSSYSDLNNSFMFTGIQYKSDFALSRTNDDRAIETFRGTAEIEGTAELFINGTKYLQKDILPGDFSIDGLYNPFTSTGEAKILIKDVNGKVTSITRPLLGTPKNLKEGTSLYSLETGFLRANDSSLGNTFISGDYTYGVNRNLTLSGHFEATKDIQNISGMATFGTDIGTFKVGASVGEGSTYDVGYFYNSKDLYLNIDYLKHNNQKGIASTYYKNDSLLAITSNYAINKNQKLNLSYVKTDDNKYVSFGTTWKLANNVFLQTSISKNNKSRTSAFIGLEFSLGKVNSNSQYDSKTNIFSSIIRSDTNKINDFNYTAQYLENNGRKNINANLNYMSQYADINTSIRTNGETNANFNIKGAVVDTNNSLNFSRQIYDSYAIIDSKSEATSINSNAGYRGKTSSNGKMVYPISSLSPNIIFLNTEEFPDDKSPMETTIKFNAYPNSPALVSVKILSPGFFISIKTDKSTITINNNTYYKTKKGFYVDDLATGKYDFQLDGKIYNIDTSNIKPMSILNLNS